MTVAARPAALHLATLDQAAALFQVHPRTIRRRIADGTITGYRSGPRLLRVDLDELSRVMLQPIPTASRSA